MHFSSNVPHFSAFYLLQTLINQCERRCKTILFPYANSYLKRQIKYLSYQPHYKYTDETTGNKKKLSIHPKFVYKILINNINKIISEDQKRSKIKR